MRNALRGLKRDNILYENIIIDEDLLDSWPEHFVPQDSMVLVERIIPRRCIDVQKIKNGAMQQNAPAMQTNMRMNSMNSKVKKLMSIIHLLGLLLLMFHKIPYTFRITSERL